MLSFLYKCIVDSKTLGFIFEKLYYYKTVKIFKRTFKKFSV